MRYIKLILSILIGFIGTIVYFVTIPTIDEETMIQATVEAGDENLLDDIYFYGYMMNYSSFLFNQEDTIIYDELPYLEQLDLSEPAEVTLLQREYPDFMNDFLYDVNFATSGMTTNEDYLALGYFEFLDNSYDVNFNQMKVQVLDKESGKVSLDTIQRDNFPTGDTIEFLAAYQEYPRVKFLVRTIDWDTRTGEQDGQLSFIEYNIETKDYSEEKIAQIDGYYYNAFGREVISPNKSLQTFTISPDYVETSTYLFNFEDDSLTEIGTDTDHFVTSQDNKLYSLTNENGEVLLNLYDERTIEIVEQTQLAFEETIDFAMESPYVFSDIADGKLYIMYNRITTGEEITEEIPPSTLYVFDIETGELLLESDFHFDVENQSLANEVLIDSFGLLSDF